MQADVLPALGVVTGLELKQVSDAWDKARASALRQNHGYDDSRTYVLTLETFRQAHPFSYADLGIEVRRMPGGQRAASTATA